MIAAQPPAIGKKGSFRARFNGAQVEVSGFPCAIPGFDGIEFFVHRLLDDYWSLNEVSTGANVEGGATRPVAIANASRLLNMYGKEKVAERIKALAPQAWRLF